MCRSMGEIRTAILRTWLQVRFFDDQSNEMTGIVPDPERFTECGSTKFGPDQLRPFVYWEAH